MEGRGGEGRRGEGEGESGVEGSEEWRVEWSGGDGWMDGGLWVDG